MELLLSTKGGRQLSCTVNDAVYKFVSTLSNFKRFYQIFRLEKVNKSLNWWLETFAIFVHFQNTA